jgi:hypothetical protein
MPEAETHCSPSLCAPILLVFMASYASILAAIIVLVHPHAQIIHWRLWWRIGFVFSSRPEDLSPMAVRAQSTEKANVL